MGTVFRRTISDKIFITALVCAGLSFFDWDATIYRY